MYTNTGVTVLLIILFLVHFGCQANSLELLDGSINDHRERWEQTNAMQMKWKNGKWLVGNIVEGYRIDTAKNCGRVCSMFDVCITISSLRHVFCLYSHSLS